MKSGQIAKLGGTAEADFRPFLGRNQLFLLEI